jgi:hypothetical protein
MSANIEVRLFFYFPAKNRSNFILSLQTNAKQKFGSRLNPLVGK